MADSAIGKSRTTTIAQQSKDERPRDGLDVSGAFAPVVGLGGAGTTGVLIRRGRRIEVPTLYSLWIPASLGSRWRDYLACV
jgi:hypothetical protein